MISSSGGTGAMIDQRTTHMNKKLATAGVTLGLLAGGAAGFALGTPGSSSAAQSTEATTTVATSGSTTSGTTATDRGADHAARLQEVLGSLVTDGTLTQAQLDAVIAELETAGPMGGPGGGRHGGGVRIGLDAAATALGITADELRTELEAGKTIAEVATTKGVDIQTVIDAVVADIKTHLDEEVAEGDLTQAEADTRLADATTRVTDMVDNVRPAGGPGMGGHRGGMGHHGPDDADDDTTDSNATTTTTIG